MAFQRFADRSTEVDRVFPGQMSITRPGSFFKLLALALGASVLVWRIVAVNLSGFHLQAGGVDAATGALAWDKSSPEALYQKGLEALAADQGRSLSYFNAAVSNNPADGLTYAAIGEILEAQGNSRGAELAMRAAAGMAPQRVNVQYQVASFWMRRGDIAQAMKHLDVVLTFGTSLRAELFPDLLKLAENPATREAAFSSLLQQPTVWWPDFFAYAANNATDVETLRALSAMRATGPNLMSPTGLRAYLQRLQHDRLWFDAYITWLNSLRRDRLNAIGNLFNGDFEEEISNTGFDWIVTPTSQVVVETASTYGTTGSKALRVLFRGPRVQFQHLRQHLLLDPGNYILRGRVRPENLEATEGVRWSIYCHSQTEALARSETIRGTDPWSHFSMSFEVPAKDCAAQTVRLELAGRSPLDFEAKGTVWFDDMSISRRRLD